MNFSLYDITLPVFKAAPTGTARSYAMSIYVSVKGAKTLVESLKSQEPKAKIVGPEALTMGARHCPGE
jgi:hypothetical protein